MKTLIKAQLYNYLHSQLSIMSQWKLRDCINHCNLPEQIPLPNISQKWRLRVELKPLNLPVKLHSLGGAMKNFTCDILRNNVEPGWYRANGGPIQAGQCWADTGKYIDFYHGMSSVLAQYRLYCCRYKQYSPVQRQHWPNTCMFAGWSGQQDMRLVAPALDMEDHVC